MTRGSAATAGAGPGRLVGHILFFALLLTPLISMAEPPWSGTVFVDPDIITGADSTAFVELVHTGTGTRTMFDRRVNDWVQLEAILFDATYSDGFIIEFQVNPEFGSVEAARVQANFYAEAIGRLPIALRTEVHSSSIHMGDEAFGGGNNNLLIHTDRGQINFHDGFLEEVLVHEASHTSLDPSHSASGGWLQAQQADGEFISNWARDHPDREDVAESFLVWLALRHRAGRVSESTANTILDTIPNRIAYFDDLDLNLAPVTGVDFLINAGLNDAWFNPETDGQGFFIIVFPDVGQMFMAWFTYETERPDASITAQLGEAGHRWLTAQGPYAGHQAVLEVFVSSGGVFDSPDPASSIRQDGEMIVEFSGCNAGTVSYDIPSIGRQGVVPIERIVLDNVPLCESLQNQMQ